MWAPLATSQYALETLRSRVFSGGRVLASFVWLCGVGFVRCRTFAGVLLLLLADAFLEPGPLAVSFGVSHLRL
jgi:hypothetical protein